MRITLMLLGTVLVLAVALLARHPSARERVALDEQGFAHAVLERLQARVPDGRFTLRERDGHPAIEMRGADGTSGTWFLGNAYQQYNGDPAQLDAIVAHQLKSWSETRAAMSAAAPARAAAAAHVLPVIKTRDWLDATTAQLTSMGTPDKSADSVPLHRDLAGDLVLVFAEDDAGSMRYVGRGSLDALRLRDPAALEQRALDNLAARLSELRITGKDGRYRLELDNFYEASMVLLAARWRERLTLDGDPVIALAARNTVLVCGSHDHAAIESLRRYAADVSRQAAYGLSAQLYTLREGRLAEYRP